LCAAGDERAWEQFVRDYRPILYRAADALDRTGAAREVADSLYADLYGVKDGERERQSLFRYFQGRSSLATWLRAVLAQRWVDRLRAARRLEPLPEEEPAAAAGETPDPDRARYAALVRDALARAVARLDSRDRLRLGCYYVQELTLAEIGRVMKESEATASRQLARVRLAIRREVELRLRDQSLSDDQIAACFASVADDPGPIDLKQVIYE
jgi:RNA polymerase sigma-70 factor (ECF subfamily)